MWASKEEKYDGGRKKRDNLSGRAFDTTTRRTSTSVAGFTEYEKFKSARVLLRLKPGNRIGPCLSSSYKIFLPADFLPSFDYCIGN